MNKLKETTDERGAVYGNYMDTIEGRSKIMNILLEHHKRSNDGLPMALDEQVMLGDIVMKLIRISASPSYYGGYHDIAGYATLIKEEYCKEN